MVWERTLCLAKQIDVEEEVEEEEDSVQDGFKKSPTALAEGQKILKKLPSTGMCGIGLCMMSPGVARDLTDAESDTLYVLYQFMNIFYMFDKKEKQKMKNKYCDKKSY